MSPAWTVSRRAQVVKVILLGMSSFAALTCQVRSETLLDWPKKPIEAEDFAAQTADGKSIRLSDFKGKVVFLNFWATWCVPCREEMPAMQRIHETMKDQPFKMLAVNIQETAREVLKYGKELNLSFDLVLDPTGEISRTYGANALPLTYIIDKRHMVVARAIGSRPWDGKAYRACLVGIVAAQGESADSYKAQC